MIKLFGESKVANLSKGVRRPERDGMNIGGRRKVWSAVLFFVVPMFLSAGCRDEMNRDCVKEKPVELIWYQIGERQNDLDEVLRQVNAYTAEKIGVTVEIIPVTFSDYNQKMRSVVSTGTRWDIAFSSSWANDYVENAKKGALLPLDSLLAEYAPGLLTEIDEKFWKAAKVSGVTYGIPSEKEIGNMPVWVFTKEYVDKYKIPCDSIHTLEDLEPYLALMKEKEPDVVPLYLTKDFSAPTYMDKIADPIGIEYGDETLTVKDIFETDRMMKTLRTLHRYYEAGYINRDAAIARDDKSVKRFVTKGDGQPYADVVWSKDLGYRVVTSPIMEVQVTNASARGALTVVSKDCRHPKKAVEFLNLVNTDLYVRNLLNYGIENVHYKKVPVTRKEKEEAEGKRYIYGWKVHFLPESVNYSVPYYVQGSLFGTYVPESDPIDKWDNFRRFNDQSVEAPAFGFDFDSASVISQIYGFRNILDEYGPAIYTGTVDPDIYVPKLVKKFKENGMQAVIDEMQLQINGWRDSPDGGDTPKTADAP